MALVDRFSTSRLELADSVAEVGSQLNNGGPHMEMIVQKWKIGEGGGPAGPAHSFPTKPEGAQVRGAACGVIRYAVLPFCR